MRGISDLNALLSQSVSIVCAVTALFFSQLTLVGANKRCESHRVSLRDAVQDHAIYEHVLRKVNATNFHGCYEQCIDECSCRTFQMYKNIDCELLYEDRYSAPQYFQPRPGYKYYQLIRTYQCPSSTCNGSVCSNKCCDPNPCLNGGTCTELCHDPRTKFECACAPGFKGRFCGKELFLKSCIDYLAQWPGSKSGEYQLLDAADRTYRTYCDFDLNGWMVWTLIESFALSERVSYRSKAFFIDHATATDAAHINWHSFRLSLTHMKELRNQTTHFRATCNFAASGGASYTDYLRVKMTELNPITFNSDKCATFEFLSIHGHNCSECLFYLDQRSNYHIYVNSYKGPKKCPTWFTVPSAVPGQGPDFRGEDNFGKYVTTNPVHGCSSSSSATTQWWLGRSLCEDSRIHVNCTCPNGYIGKWNGRFCGKALLRKSCKGYLAANPGSKTGEYYLLDSAGKPYRSFCDFDSEAGMAWTLIESFDFQRKGKFKSFYIDDAIYDKSFNWPSFRLSLSHMKDLRNQSTHFRATCNYSTAGEAINKDYLRVKMSEVDPITLNDWKCVNFEFLSIHGYNCSNCVFGFDQRSSHHLHIDSSLSPSRCSTSFSVPSAVVVLSADGNGEDDFGYFSVSNPLHRCSSSASATTEWWFGA